MFRRRLRGRMGSWFRSSEMILERFRYCLCKRVKIDAKIHNYTPEKVGEQKPTPPPLYLELDEMAAKELQRGRPKPTPKTHNLRAAFLRRRFGSTNLAKLSKYLYHFVSPELGLLIPNVQGRRPGPMFRFLFTWSASKAVSILELLLGALKPRHSCCGSLWRRSIKWTVDLKGQKLKNHKKQTIKWFQSHTKHALINLKININSCVIPNSLEDLGEFLAICPELSGTSSAICPGTCRNLISHLHRNPLEPHQLSAPEPSKTLSAICPGTLRNLISNLHQNCRDQMVPGSIPGGRILSRLLDMLRHFTTRCRCQPVVEGFGACLCLGGCWQDHWRGFGLPNQGWRNFGRGVATARRSWRLRRSTWKLWPLLPCNMFHSFWFVAYSTPHPACTDAMSLLCPEPHQLSAPKLSGTSSAICTGTLRNPSEPFGTASAICTGTLRNPPEPSPEPGVAAAPDHTRAILG